MKNLLLATTAVVVLAGGAASAADLPLKAASPAYLPVNSWAGPYIGAHVGVGRMNESANQTQSPRIFAQPCGGYNASCVATATGVVGGVEVGYDWQDRYFVYGVAADWTWTDLEHGNVRTSGTSGWHHQAKIDWLASFRGRAGLAVDNTLVYVTGGLALGHLKSSAGITCAECDAGNSATNFGALDSTKVGWVAGGGVEHKFNQHWSAKAEALYYDLGRESASGLSRTGNTYTTEFHHEVIVGRMGVNYRF